MAGRKVLNMVESSESKLDVIINAINVVVLRTVEIEGNFAKLPGATRVGVAQTRVQRPQISSASEVLPSTSQHGNLVIL